MLGIAIAFENPDTFQPFWSVLCTLWVLGTVLHGAVICPVEFRDGSVECLVYLILFGIR